MGLTWNFINGGLAVLVLSLPFAVAGSTSASSGRQPPQTAPAGGQYAGEATCLTCHDDHSYKGTAHGLAFNERTPAANRGCESCHGPGKAHADSGDPALIRNFKTTRPSEVSAT